MCALTQQLETEQTGIIFDLSQDEAAQARQAIDDAAVLSALIDALSGPERRVRQFCAAAVREVSRQEPKLLVSRVNELVDALSRPEAQTRWEMFEVLAHVLGEDAGYAETALEAAELGLYDEASGTVRLSAFRFLSQVAIKRPDLAEDVWELLDDALQCYHGDPEFAGMLESLRWLLEHNQSSELRQRIADRMRFDAENASGFLLKEAKSLLELAERS